MAPKQNYDLLLIQNCLMDQHTSCSKSPWNVLEISTSFASCTTTAVKDEENVNIAFIGYKNPKLAVLKHSPILVSVKAVDLWSNTNAME